MTKRGRPRKEGRRDKGGRLLRVRDEGTPEFQAKRAMLIPAKGDTQLASYWLGVLKAHEIVSPEHLEAGGRYAWLFGKATGRYDIIAGQDYERTVGPEDGEGRAAELKEKWQHAIDWLMAAGRPAKDAVDNLVLYNRLPHWFVTDRPRPSDARELAATIAGLTMLAQAFGLNNPGRRATVKKVA